MSRYGGVLLSDSQIQLATDHVLIEFTDVDGVAFTITPISVRYLIALRRAPEIIV